MHIRSYQPGDLPALAALDAACFQPPFRFSRRTVHACAERPGAVVRLAMASPVPPDGEPLLGFAIVHMEPNPASGDAYLVTLDVTRAARRGGVGRALLLAVEAAAACAGAAAMQLHVFVENQPAQALYAGAGYTVVGMAPNYYGPGLHGLVYRKPLVCAP